MPTLDRNEVTIDRPEAFNAALLGFLKAAGLATAA